MKRTTAIARAVLANGARIDHALWSGIKTRTITIKIKNLDSAHDTPYTDKALKETSINRGMYWPRRRTADQTAERMFVLFQFNICALIIVLLLAACKDHRPQSQVVETKGLMASNQFKGFRLGMSLEEAIEAGDGIQWNENSLNNCVNDMPLQGCILSQYPSRVMFSLDGIPFSPVLSFNKHGILTDIGLRYERETGIAGDDCISLLARSIDYLGQNYGKMAFPTESALSQGWTTRVLQTSMKIPFSISVDSKDGSWVSQPMRNQLAFVKLPTSSPITTWNHLDYVSVMANFMKLGKGSLCNIVVEFSLPSDIERLPDT